MLNVPFDVNFEKQLIKKEAEECWENLMEYASRRNLEPDFVHREFREERQPGGINWWHIQHRKVRQILSFAQIKQEKKY